MSVSMILKLVDQVSGPAKGVESELQKLKRATDVLNDIQKGPMKSSKWDEGLKVIQKRREELLALQQSEQRAARAVETSAQTVAAAKTSEARGATAAASQIVAANEKIAASERQTAAAQQSGHTIEAAKRAEAESATAAANQIVAANERIAASEQRTVAAIERSAKEQAAAQAALQRQRSAAHQRQVIEDDKAARAARAAAESHGVMSKHGAGGVALGAAASYVGVHSVYHVGRETLVKGSEYQHERVGLENAGRSIEELAELEKAAHAVTQSVPTATYTEALKALNETTGAFGSVEHAVANLPFVMRTASVLKSAAGDKIHDDPGEMGNKLARFFEERGTAGNSEVFQKEANEMVRAMVFTRGNFNPSQMLNFAQQAKSSLQNYDLQFLSRVVPSLVTTFGGDRAGTAANAFSKTIMGKVNDAKQAGSWEQYGLIDPEQAIKKNGKVVSWQPGAVTNTNTALSNPLEFMEKTVLPALKAHGVNIEDRLELSKVLNSLYRNPNAEIWAEELAQTAQRTRLHKDAKLIDETKSPDEIYRNNLSSDPTAAISSLTAALQNLQTAASAPAMKTASSAISSVAGALQSLSQIATDHPKASMEVAGGLGAVALGGAGWLSYQVAKGFGLPAAAAELTVAAKALDGAAGKLAVANGIKPGVPGTAPSGVSGPGFWRTGVAAVDLFLATLNGPTNAKEWNEKQAENDQFRESAGEWIKNHTPAWLNPPKAILERSPEEMPPGSPGRIWADNAKRDEAGAKDQGSAKQDETSAKAQSAVQTLQMLNGQQVTPNVDASPLDALNSKGGEAHQTLLSINGTFSPKVDTSSIDAAIEKAAKLKQVLGGLGGLGGGGRSFTPSSGALHDGPEHR